jgi:hypothetical protein
MRTHRFSVVNGLTVFGGLVMLIAGLAMIDVRVRDQLGRLLTGRGPSGELATLGDRVQSLLTIAMQAARDQSIENAPLVIFALAALVLVLFMTRT